MTTASGRWCWADDSATDGHALRSGTFPCAGATDLKDASVRSCSEQATYGYGSEAQLGITVTGDGAPRPSGTVTVTKGATVLGSANLSDDGSPTTVEVSTALLGAGTHELTATYSGDSLYKPSTTPPTR